MEIVPLSSTNFIGLTANYKYDSSFKLNQAMYYTEQGMGIPLVEILGDLNDTSTNNYSNLFLTKYTTLTSNTTLDSILPVQGEGFSSYLAISGYSGINSNTRFIVAEEPAVTVAKAGLSATGTYDKIDNSYYFDIILLDSLACRISHINNNVTRYLTVNGIGLFSFQTDLGGVSGQTYDIYNSQVFFYNYDRTCDLLVLSKNIDSALNYVAYDPTGQTLALVPPITGTLYPSFSATSIFSLLPRNEVSNTAVFNDPWVSYQRNLRTNTQDINPDRSYSNVKSNVLVHAEYNTVSGNNIDVNLLSLKNTNTPENYQSRNNPFQNKKSNYFTESEVEMRRYNNLFSGSNQTYGNDNITLGYEAYTTNILLPADKITYFHIPQNIYPYIEINVADSGLIEAGAIAGDHPMKSDKIFKKLASAKYTTPYGTTGDLEQTGQFLCSWLSGCSTDINVKPIWVDRYYNPLTTTFVSALTSTTLTARNFTNTYNNLSVSASRTFDKWASVFDKVSDLTLEPGAYYAYHHLGPKDIKQYISSLQSVLVDNQFAKYLYVNGSNARPDGSVTEEFAFNGNQYAITQSLSTLNSSNQFTICFDAYSSDWTKPFAHQIVGNLEDTGIGIFNQNTITPTLFINSPSNLTILNTDFTPIKTVSYTSKPIGYLRYGAVSPYYVIFSDGSFAQYNANDIATNKIQNNNLSGVVAYDYNDSTAYILCSAAVGSGYKTIITQATLSSFTVASSAIHGELYPDAFWNLNESSGIRANSVLNNYLSPGSASVGATTGIYNNKNAADFSGTIVKCLSTNSFSLSGFTNISISFWVKNVALTRANILGSYLNNQKGPLFYVDGVTQNITWYPYGGSNTEQATSNTAITDSNWHHVVGTADGSNINIYIDGKLDGTATVDPGGNSTTQACSSFFGLAYTGQSNIGNFRGAIDEVGIYTSRVLSADEVAALYNSAAGSSYLLSALNVSLNYAPDTSTGWIVASGTSFTTPPGTIDLYNNKLYLTPGTLSRRLKNTIFYLKDNNTTIARWDNIDSSTTTAVTTAFKSTTGISDFNIDFDSNVWILNTSNNFYKFKSNRTYILSGSIASNTTQTITTTLTGDGLSKNFVLSGSQSIAASDYIVISNNRQLRPIYEYSIHGNNIRFISIPLSGSQITVTTNVDSDTYNNYRINFVSEFAGNAYNEYALITRAGYNTALTQSLSTQGYQFNLLDLNGNQINGSAITTLTSSSVDIINNDYLRSYVNDKYGDANLNVKAVLAPAYNSNNVNTGGILAKNYSNTLPVELIYSLSAVDPGYHHFTVRFDAYYGYMSLFIDGQMVGNTTFPARKYLFSDTFARPLIFGSSLFRKNIPLFQYLHKKSYLTNDLIVKNYYLYNKPLNTFDIMHHAREGMQIHDINIDIPCGRRNYLEEIERYFKASVPGSKSTFYNLNIKNTGITDLGLRAALEQRILIELKKTAPVYAQLNKINWIN
jgi:hypothetical protein